MAAVESSSHPEPLEIFFSRTAWVWSFVIFFVSYVGTKLLDGIGKRVRPRLDTWRERWRRVRSEADEEAAAGGVSDEDTPIISIKEFHRRLGVAQIEMDNGKLEEIRQLRSDNESLEAAQRSDRTRLLRVAEAVRRMQQSLRERAREESEPTVGEGQEVVEFGNGNEESPTMLRRRNAHSANV